MSERGECWRFKIFKGGEAIGVFELDVRESTLKLRGYEPAFSSMPNLTDKLRASISELNCKRFVRLSLEGGIVKPVTYNILSDSTLRADNSYRAKLAISIYLTTKLGLQVIPELPLEHVLILPLDWVLFDPSTELRAILELAGLKYRGELVPERSYHDIVGYNIDRFLEARCKLYSESRWFDMMKPTEILSNLPTLRRVFSNLRVITARSSEVTFKLLKFHGIELEQDEVISSETELEPASGRDRVNTVRSLISNLGIPPDKVLYLDLSEEVLKLVNSLGVISVLLSHRPRDRQGSWSRYHIIPINSQNLVKDLIRIVASNRLTFWT